MNEQTISNIVSVETLAETHRPGQRLIGLDLGTKTIGIALSDGGLRIASAHSVIKRKKFTSDAAQIIELANAENVFALVLGLPLNMDGSKGPRAQSSSAFARNFANVSDLPICFWDERLSTVAAERPMLEADMSRKKRAEKIDALAATIILQGALDRIGNL